MTETYALRDRVAELEALLGVFNDDDNLENRPDQN